MDDTQAASGLEVWIILAAIGFVICGVSFVLNKRKRRLKREAFLANFDEALLRSATGQLGTVYRVMGESGTKVQVRPVWRDTGPVASGETQEFEAEDLSPFNRERFLSFH